MLLMKEQSKLEDISYLFSLNEWNKLLRPTDWMYMFVAFVCSRTEDTHISRYDWFHIE